MPKTVRVSAPRQGRSRGGVRYDEFVATSLDEYTETAARIYESWEDSDADFPDPWFRGVQNASHKLIPGFYRLPQESKEIEEDDYREEFMRRSPPLLNQRLPSDKWEWYFLMQHYGLPTRLLDWSEGSLIGLFFALESQTTLSDAVSDVAVWILDAWRFNKWSTGKSEVFVYSEKSIQRYLCDKPFVDEDNWPQRPVAILPTYNSLRIASQRGMFTIHGKNRKPLEEMLPVVKEGTACLAKILIRAEHIARMREELRRTGMTDIVLFPELPSLALDIRRAWERRPLSYSRSPTFRARVSRTPPGKNRFEST